LSRTLAANKKTQKTNFSGRAEFLTSQFTMFKTLSEMKHTERVSNILAKDVFIDTQTDTETNPVTLGTCDYLM
jgi:hypothetical protein